MSGRPPWQLRDGEIAAAPAPHPPTKPRHHDVIDSRLGIYLDLVA
jgi:hypothetical protein